ncbi:MAG: sulfatase-like hydrolase/transferase [Oscillospiraceae bacterium]|nr:sulfatase-like hydrolase/transferase [Oscillospiraceae bacterium]
MAASEFLNVLLIMTDQHRADYMSCTGASPVNTPSIDKIARRGIRYENAYCAYPVCVASRNAMLTALYPHTTGVITNSDRLDRRYQTMAHHFNSFGYMTGLVGKMHFNDSCTHGFEYYTSINDWLMYLGPKVSHYADEIANHQLTGHFFSTVIDDGAGFPDLSDVWEGNISPWAGAVKKYPEGRVASELDEGDHLDMFVARESAKFLEKYKDQRFFLTASFMKPHTPFYPPKRYAEMFPLQNIGLKEPGDLSGYPEYVKNYYKGFANVPEIQRKAARAGYFGNLAFADGCIGYLYEKLESLGLIENTLVIYTSDHGEMDGDHGLYQKFCMFEPAVKVPLIMSCPGFIQENAVCGNLISQLGLYPTLAELTGTSPVSPEPLAHMENPPEKLDAESFAESVFDPGAQISGEVFAEFNVNDSARAQYMLRAGDYKYVAYASGEGELYDLKKDPGERFNLFNAAGYSETTDVFREKIKNRLYQKGKIE